MTIPVPTYLTALKALATKENKEKLLAFLKSNWKTILVVGVIGYFVYNYWSMTNEIESLKSKQYSSDIVLSRYEDNVRVLKNAIDTQNIYVKELEQFSIKQTEAIVAGEKAAASLSVEYEDRIRNLMNKPPTIISCEDNMQWLVDEAEVLKWTF